MALAPNAKADEAKLPSPLGALPPPPSVNSGSDGVELHSPDYWPERIKRLIADVEQLLTYLLETLGRKSGSRTLPTDAPFAGLEARELKSVAEAATKYRQKRATLVVALRNLAEKKAAVDPKVAEAGNAVAQAISGIRDGGQNANNRLRVIDHEERNAAKKSGKKLTLSAQGQLRVRSALDDAVDQATTVFKKTSTVVADSAREIGAVTAGIDTNDQKNGLGAGKVSGSRGNPRTPGADENTQTGDNEQTVTSDQQGSGSGIDPSSVIAALLGSLDKKDGSGGEDQGREEYPEDYSDSAYGQHAQQQGQGQGQGSGMDMSKLMAIPAAVLSAISAGAAGLGAMGLDKAQDGTATEPSEQQQGTPSEETAQPPNAPTTADLPKDVAAAIDRSSREGVDARVAYEGTKGDGTVTHPWREVPDTQVRTGDVVEYRTKDGEVRSELVLRGNNGLEVLHKGQRLALDTNSLPEGGSLLRFAHPSGLDQQAAPAPAAPQAPVAQSA